MNSLFDAEGSRKHLTEAERARFLAAAGRCERKVQAFCHTLAWSGCRISEALALTPGRVNLDAATLPFECLTKRRPGQFRSVPVPPELARMLDHIFGIREARGRTRVQLLWTWSRTTAWRRVTEVLDAAGIHSTPKVLRHGVGVAAVGRGILLNLVQRWLGHAQLTTTAIYAEEERTIAARLWQGG